MGQYCKRNDTVRVRVCRRRSSHSFSRPHHHRVSRTTQRRRRRPGHAPTEPVTAVFHLTRSSLITAVAHALLLLTLTHTYSLSLPLYLTVYLCSACTRIAHATRIRAYHAHNFSHDNNYNNNNLHLHNIYIDCRHHQFQLCKNCCKILSQYYLVT